MTNQERRDQLKLLKSQLTDLMIKAEEATQVANDAMRKAEGLRFRIEEHKQLLRQAEDLASLPTK